METKSKWQSKGLWGAGVTVLASIAGILGYAVSVEDVDALTALLTSLAENVTLVITAGAGVLAWIGRLKATKKLS